LYQFSLQFFLDIFGSVLLNNPHLNNVSESSARLSIVTTDLFSVTYNRVARGMLHSDRITFCLLLGRIYLKQKPNEPTYDAEFQHLLRGQEGLVQQHAAVAGLSPEQLDAMHKLSKLKAFKEICNEVQSNPV
jgi:dynein heavy chain 1